MTREKVLRAMDLLNAKGYTVSIMAIPPRDGWRMPDADDDGRVYRLEIQELGVDKVDLKALVAVADELDLDVGVSRLAGRVEFSAMPKKSVADTPRSHPR